MKKANRLVFLIVSIVSVIAGIFLFNFYRGVFPSSDMGANFVKRCADLNGKDLAYENIATLNGKIYIAKSERDGSGTVGLKSLKKDYIDQYLQSFSNKLDPLIFHPNVYEESFDMSRGGLDDDWRCNIKMDKGSRKIKTTPYFQPGA